MVSVEYHLLSIQVALEAVKNLILAGPKQVTLFDQVKITM